MSFDSREGLNVPMSTLSEFFDDLEGRLSLITGLYSMEEQGLSLADVRKPMLVIGLPGIGKTCGIMSIIKKLNSVLPADKKLGFKKILLGQTVVGSMSGIPIIGADGKVIRVQVPDLPDEERDGKYGVLFLDEITTADEAQVQPALGLCDDSRCIGEYTLPENWIVVAAGNGPDCTNFIRLDDMTLTRFTAYDIAYDYRKDWRPWAHKNGVNEDIIAFLSFDPTACVRVESSEVDSAGKMFPCPRTWERLSTELKMRQAFGKPVKLDTELVNFAGRIVGIKAAREFSAFCKYKTKVDYDIDKIINGTERQPDPMDKQIFHIILQGVIKKLELALSRDYNNNTYSDESYEKVANVVNWFMVFEKIDYDSCMNAIVEFRNETTHIQRILADYERFDAVCSSFSDFAVRNADFILGLDF